ncbi:uncharacterized protein LOC126840678 [Adelges cooleyi]|uniref:uncharacterized protein LOC126840678 n=1 Tax=Adelges cooleyi TaxID=133065 RepID=UPI00217FCD85|nr:uncharacterized protein LOC126840678 [Adelges cooleyi]
MNKASENYGFFCNQIENINYFYPVDVLWRRQKCHALGLKLKRPLDYRANKKILGTPSKYKFIGGTGNCFYRALSYVVTGTEHNQFLLRTKISQVVRTNDKILHFLDGEEELTKYLKLININEEDTWSTSVDVLAAAILLNTSIYIYNSIKERWYFFSKDYPAAYSSVSTENERFIYLLNLSLTHFHIVEDIRFL